MKKEFKNRGVLLGERTTDYHANEKVGALPYEIRNPQGDWELYLPPGEWQASDRGDSMSCVSFGEINGIETQEKQQTGNQLNYSDRWIAKMSNTTRQGNYLYTVADAIRKYGLVLESDYPAPASYTWDEYHADIPEPLLSQLKAKGQEWLKKWEVSYEWVDFSKESLIKHLKHGPLSVVLPGHLVLNFHTTQDIIHYFDSYPSPYKKTTTNVIQAMKVLLTPRAETLDPDTLLVDIKYGDWGAQVQKLKRALVRNGWVEFNALEDIYDDKMAELVMRFKMAKVYETFWGRMWERYFYKGKEVNARDREVINAVLNK